jgi:hypothetical protein
MRKRFLPIVLVIGVLSFARPGHAGMLQDGWNRSLSVVETTTGYILSPFQAAAEWALNFLRSEERALAAELNRFVTTLRQDLSRFETLAGRAGFSLSNVSIKPGIIPEVELAFEPAEEITPAAEAALRQELAQLTGAMGALERAVILLLLDVDERVEAIRPNGFRVGEVAFALVAIFPEMTINFVRSETAAR